MVAGNRILKAVVGIVGILNAEAFAPGIATRPWAALSKASPFTLVRSIVEDPRATTDNVFENIRDDGDVISITNSDQASFDSPIAPEDQIDKALNRALSESIHTVEEKLPTELKDAISMSVMEDEDFKKEVAQIFHKASVDLKEALDDIRREQDEFVKESAAKSAAKTMAAMKEDHYRLNQAEESMVKMIDRVNRESREVERAVDELKKAQANMSKDPLLMIANGGIVKQAALAGALLFTTRSVVDAVAMMSGDSTHAVSALVQGAIALVCVAFLLFSSTNV
jgi:hypothetical protein